MDIATNLVAGIASSLLAIGITETYHWIRLRRGKRNLGEALGFYNAPCAVVTPSFSVEIAGTKARFGETSDRVRVIREPDVYAIGTAVAVCREASSLPTVMPAKPGLQNPPPNLICVGSWSGNDVSAIMLENHCPGFRIVNREKEQSDFDSIYYECGDQIFRDTPQETHAFIMKMSPAYTGLTGSVIILWGHPSSGNQAAAEYLANNSEKLAALSRRSPHGSYCAVLAFNEQLGFRSVHSLRDMSDSVFGDRSRYGFARSVRPECG